jgi:hypothetical protein
MKMVTYIYWAFVLGLMLAVVFVAGFKPNNLILGLVGALVILAVGWAVYYFHFEQVFVKRWGGVMTITVPAGEHHIAATWKEGNLWIENFDPDTNTCYFREYSKGNLLQGKATIKTAILSCQLKQPNKQSIEVLSVP